MLKLQTPVIFPEPDFRISHEDITCMLGSCFSNNIGNKLINLKFNTFVNPFGVLYNPASIANAINLLIEKEEFTSDNLDFFNGSWLSFNHYTSFSNPDKTKCLAKINDSFKRAKQLLLNANFLFITLGTSYAFRLKKNNQIVANCHKIPGKEFDHIFLDANQTVSLLYDSIEKLKQFNPNLKIVLTVSPIRHLKDGAMNNTRSKATLILAIQELEKQFPQISYLPIYELYMDEMRDYRFYAQDMVHPNELAIEYTWERFSDQYFSTDTKNLISIIDKINRSLLHRPINAGTEEHKKFLNKLEDQILSVAKRYAYLNFKIELETISKIREQYF